MACTGSHCTPLVGRDTANEVEVVDVYIRDQECSIKLCERLTIEDVVEAVVDEGVVVVVLEELVIIEEELVVVRLVELELVVVATDDNVCRRG